MCNCASTSFCIKNACKYTNIVYTRAMSVALPNKNCEVQNQKFGIKNLDKKLALKIWKAT